MKRQFKQIVSLKQEAKAPAHTLFGFCCMGRAPEFVTTDDIWHKSQNFLKAKLILHYRAPTAVTGDGIARSGVSR